MASAARTEAACLEAAFRPVKGLRELALEAIHADQASHEYGMRLGSYSTPAQEAEEDRLYQAKCDTMDALRCALAAHGLDRSICDKLGAIL